MAFTSRRSFSSVLLLRPSFPFSVFLRVGYDLINKQYIYLLVHNSNPGWQTDLMTWTTDDDGHWTRHGRELQLIGPATSNSITSMCKYPHTVQFFILLWPLCKWLRRYSLWWVQMEPLRRLQATRKQRSPEAFRMVGSLKLKSCGQASDFR